MSNPPHPSLPENDLIALARTDFWVFVELVFHVLHPSDKLVFAPYLTVIAAKLEECAAGDCRRRIFNLPPGFMKSTIISIMYVAWRLGVNPSLKFICVSYGESLATDLSSRCRSVMISKIYKKIFPKTVLAKKAEDHLTTTLGGARYSAVVGSNTTGFRAHEIIIDDPMEPADTSSEIAKEKLRDWIDQSILTRFVDPAKGVAILVMHRLAYDDISAALEDKGWDAVKFPLVATNIERWYRGAELIMSREPGDLLNSNRTTSAQAKALQLETSKYVWLSQFQQQPPISGSGVVQLDKLCRENPPKSFELYVQSWDIGATITGNESVCTTYGLFEKEGKPRLYLVDAAWMKLELSGVREMIIARDQLYKPELIVMDSQGVGLGVWQDLQKRGMVHVERASSHYGALAMQTKIERFNRSLIEFYDGRVVLPLDAPFMDRLLREFGQFPNGKLFDLLDSISQVVAQFDTTIVYARRKFRTRYLGGGS